jgi:hypothetical protein
VVAPHEAVIDEESFVEIEPRIPPLEIAGAIVRDAMAERQVLRTRRRANWIGLDEPELCDRARQRRRNTQAARDRVSPQIVERDQRKSLLRHRFV